MGAVVCHWRSAPEGGRFVEAEIALSSPREDRAKQGAAATTKKKAPKSKARTKEHTSKVKKLKEPKSNKGAAMQTSTYASALEEEDFDEEFQSEEEIVPIGHAEALSHSTGLSTGYVTYARQMRAS